MAYFRTRAAAREWTKRSNGIFVLKQLKVPRERIASHLDTEVQLKDGPVNFKRTRTSQKFYVKFPLLPVSSSAVYDTSHSLDVCR